MTPGGEADGGQDPDLAKIMLRRVKEDARSRSTRRPATEVRKKPRGRTPPVQLGRALWEMFAQRGLRSVPELKLLACWPAVAGPVAQHLHLARFDPNTGTLTLQAVSSAWITQARIISDVLVQRLNLEIGPDMVRQLRVEKVKDVPSSAWAPTPAPDGPRPLLWWREPPPADPGIAAAFERQAQCLLHQSPREP
ncbi:DciA family protein [Streptomyces sp. NPDC048297]|uniref:DciA family protein n=1 Tax=Streptomyces sp. NPDC048297 TaxID=3365531 RepID=UPI00371A5560